jgi:hypothetical protein
VVTEQARNLLMTLADRADGIKFLLRDQDTTFTAAFNAAFTAVGACSQARCTLVVSPPRDRPSP